jgi:hypothetical protein
VKGNGTKVVSVEECSASDRSVHMPRLKTGRSLNFSNKTEEEEEEEGYNLCVLVYTQGFTGSNRSASEAH